MRRAAVLCALAGFLAPLLAGCGAPGFLPYARELEDMALIRTMGVDAAPEGAAAVTVSTGARSGTGGEDAVVLSGSAGTISGACLEMQGQGSSYIYYGHVGQLLLGEDLARRGAGPALDYVLRDVEMRLDTEVYLVRGAGAGEAIRTAAKAGGSAADRLEAMEDDAGLLSHTMSRTAGDLLERLARSGAAFVPALVLGEEGELEAAGYGILKDGALAGWAGEETAGGINLVQGQVDADVLELEGAALRVVGAKTRVRPVFDGDRLTGLTLCCRVDANLAEAPEGLDLQDPAALERLERALEAREAQRIQAALDLSRALDADFLELRLAAELASPGRTADLGDQWSLDALTLEASVEGHILRSYDVSR